MKILFLEHLFPLPLDSGGKIKSYHILKALSEAHEVKVLSYVRTDEERQLVPDLSAICAGVQTVNLERSAPRRAADAALSLIRGDSFIVSRDYRSEMARAFAELVSDFQPEVVHVDHLQMSRFISSGRGYKTVLDQHNVESVIIRRIAETADSLPTRLYAGVEWPKLQRFELRACEHCDMVITVSEQDEALLTELHPGLQNVHALPIGVDVDYYQPVTRDPAARSALFLGTMYWPPNIDCVLYFHREILPLVKEQVPGFEFVIAGQRPSASVLALGADPAVRVTGYVDDTRAVSAECGVFVVPLRSGSGVRVKILNAMAMGLPVVSTSVGAEGLDVRSGEHLLLADSPEDFARAVARVLNDQALAAELGSKARKLVCEKYSWGIIGKQLLQLYETHLPGS